jgi:glycosyltransferase involved in cell wall biosynthesis
LRELSRVWRGKYLNYLKNRMHMKVIMISGDTKIYDENSFVYKRALGYSTNIEELVVVFLTKDKLAKEKKIDNLRIIPVYKENKVKGFFKLWASVKKTARNIEGQYIITAQDPFYFGLIASLVSRKYKVPFEIQVHTDIFEFTKGKIVLKTLARLTIPKANGIRVVSNSALNQIKKVVKNISAKTYIIPISIEKKDYSKAHYTTSNPTILIVSRLEKEKNIFLALEIFKKTREHVPQLELRIAGEGSLDHELRKYAVSLNVEANTVFLGFVEDLEREYGKAQVLLHTADFEGFGMVFIEAAQAGLPIVSTDIGIAKLISKFTFHKEDIDSAVTHLRNLLGGEDLWNKTSDANNKNSEKFITTKDNYVKSIVGAWSSLLE